MRRFGLALPSPRPVGHQDMGIFLRHITNMASISLSTDSRINEAHTLHSMFSS
jgi:hypothetical protein